MVGQRDLLSRCLVQMSGEPLDLAPVVGEDNGALPLADHAQQPPGEPRPERLRLHVGQVIDRTEHLQRQPLAHPGVHDLHRARHEALSLPRRAAQVAGHFLQRPLRCGEADPNQAFRRSGVQAFRPGSGIHRMDRISGMDRMPVEVRSSLILLILFIPVNSA